MKLAIAIFFLSVSIFMLIFASIYDVEYDWRQKRQITHNVEEGFNVKMNDLSKDEHLLTFLQISDIHLSLFKDHPNRAADFQKFCTDVIDVIKPKVVIASGDLTDAKDKIFGSGQYEEEWKTYYSTLVDAHVFNKTTFLDLRGNHDMFNVETHGGKRDYYRHFSAQGKQHMKSYLHQEHHEGIIYNFIALDASIQPGTKRPYNFIGTIDESELDRIDKLIENTARAKYTIFFAHYPTSTIRIPSKHENIRKFVGKFNSTLAFLAGHLHTMGNLVTRMYTLHPEGFLELELADFMKHRRYRLAVIDHGCLSFVDVSLNTWPIAIITNPKNMLFNNPFKEDINIQKGSHIRIVAYSPAKITLCKIKIDDGDWKKCFKKTENFFVVPWNFSHYANGKHKIELFVGDSDGRIFTQEQYFALDGTRISFDFLARFVLMSDLTTIFQILYAIAAMICLLPLLYFKTWWILIKRKTVKRPNIKSSYWRSFAQKYLILASIDKIFYGIVFLVIYTTFGLWSCHEILDGHVGYVFLWGLFVQGKYVEGNLSYWYGMNQLIFFQFPLTIIMAGILKNRYQSFIKAEKCNFSILTGLKANLSFVALIIAEMFLAFLSLQQNGFIPFLFAPLRTWIPIFAIFLFYHAQWKIPDPAFKRAARIFNENENNHAKL